MKTRNKITLGILTSVILGLSVFSVDAQTVYQNQPLVLQAKNITLRDANWSNSVAANPGDVIQFQITLQNTSGQTMNDITVKNVMPANLIYNGNLMLDGVSNSGNINDGLPLGNLPQGQTKAITYQVQVGPAQNFSFGTTTLTSTVFTSSTDASFNPATASAYIAVTRSGATGATDVPAGLTNNILFDSFFLPLLAAIVGIWIFRNRKRLVF